MCHRRRIRGVLVLLAGLGAMTAPTAERVHAQASTDDAVKQASPSSAQPKVPPYGSAKSAWDALPSALPPGPAAASEASAQGIASPPRISLQQMLVPPAPGGGQPLVTAPVGAPVVDFGPRCPTLPGQFWGSAEYLLWWTKGSPLPPLLTTAPPGTPVTFAGALGAPGTSILLGDQSVNAGVRSGMRFYLGGWLNQDHTTGIESSFFYLASMASHFNAASDANGSPILTRPFINANPTSAFFGTNDGLFVSYPGFLAGSFASNTTSQLLGTDVYLRQALCCGCGWRLDGLLGYRYLRLREGLGITETETGLQPPPATLQGIPIVINEGFNTLNNFNGGEIGLIGEVQRNRWFVRAVGKVAFGSTSQTVGINGTTQVLNAPPVPGGFLALPSNIGNYHTSNFSVVPEVGLNVGYAITPNVRVFTGYTFLYWTQVVRPGDQIDLRINTSQQGIGPGLVGAPLPAFRFNESSFWAQGINFGLELRY